MRRISLDYCIAVFLFHNTWISKRISDEKYLKLIFRGYMGEELHLSNPHTFNEKINWLKLYDRNDEYTDMVDKYEAKKYVAERIGSEYIIPTISVWNSVDAIDFRSLPSQFVLKCTHDSGGLIVCRDKNSLDIDAARKKISKSFKNEFFWLGREWPYKNVRPRIIAEKYMEDDSNSDGLTDYKFYCFNGEPKFLYVSRGLENHQTASISFLTLDWNFAPYERSDYKTFSSLPDKPEKLQEMIEIARILSNGLTFLRVDLYYINKRIYFSELTFSPCNGLMPFKNRNQDVEMGKLMDLSIVSDKR